MLMPDSIRYPNAKSSTSHAAPSETNAINLSTITTTKDFIIPQDMQSSNKHLEIIAMDKKIKRTAVALIKPCRDCPYKKSYDYPFNISLGSF